LNWNDDSPEMQILKKAPAVFATDHDGQRSGRYTFVSSKRIIEGFDALGWGVVDAQQPVSRKSDATHNKHLVRFRPRDGEGGQNALAFTDPRGGNQVFPEIISYNSSNGTSRWKLVSGAFSMVCANGLTVRMRGFEAVGDSMSRKHIGFDPQIAYDAVQYMSHSFVGFFETVSAMTKQELSLDVRLIMAGRAREIRFGTPWEYLGTSQMSQRIINGFPKAVDPYDLLRPRRQEDDGRDVWTTFNVLQENCVRGGIKMGKTTSRPLTNIDVLDRVNTELWDLAEEALALGGV